MTTLTPPVLIAGGGIGGLTLALALASWGRASHILEARPVFSEAGAGIQLGPNATRILKQIGVAARLAESVSCPTAVKVRDAVTGKPLTELPLGDWMNRRHHSPYWVAHRADLQSALVASAKASPLIEISMNARITAFKEGSDDVTVKCESGAAAQGCVLVGADGLWSSVRTLMQPSFKLRYSGTTAARTVLRRSEVPDEFMDGATGAWLAPTAHVVHYPIQAGNALAIVVITTGPQPAEGWGIPIPAAEIMTRVSEYDYPLHSLLARAENWHRWALFDPDPVRHWSHGRTTLLGDAAHPILPFLAQGGAMAIEDAVVLAWELTRHEGSHDIAFQAYEAQRQHRVRKVQKTSRENGTAYHLKGMAASARNLALASMPPQRIMQRYDWIYGWRHDQEYGEIEL
ncbi:MAG TPA: FAD-dependent monooxygenase [Hyphomicrobiaceae bacterium]|nr:FAD-dependent monooxygenase [Hyphomicrobiaceae bacterium]